MDLERRKLIEAVVPFSSHPGAGWDYTLRRLRSSHPNLSQLCVGSGSIRAR